MNCELNTSILGTKEYWDKVYTEEEENFKNHGDVGEIWFGEGSINRLIKWIIQNPKISKDDAIIDLGCGNGVTLLELAKNGYSNLLGVDYSEKAIELATSIIKKENISGISFKTCNLTELLNPNINEFILAIDKGTYDAISLHPDDAKTKRDIYVKNVHSLLRQNGYLVVITCCWTEEEITSHFKNYFKLRCVIPTPQIRFGGNVGKTTTCLVFDKENI